MRDMLELEGSTSTQQEREKEPLPGSATLPTKTESPMASEGEMREKRRQLQPTPISSAHWPSVSARGWRMSADAPMGGGPMGGGDGAMGGGGGGAVKLWNRRRRHTPPNAVRQTTHTPSAHCAGWKVMRLFWSEPNSPN